MSIDAGGSAKTRRSATAIMHAGLARVPTTAGGSGGSVAGVVCGRPPIIATAATPKPTTTAAVVSVTLAARTRRLRRAVATIAVVGKPLLPEWAAAARVD